MEGLMVSYESYEPIRPLARVGFIIPSSNRMVEPQMHRYMPAGVIPHITRLEMHGMPLTELAPKLLEAAALLAKSKCDVTVFQCTGSSMSGGVEMEKRVVRDMSSLTGRPALSAASSVTAALQALGARKLVFISENEQAGHDKKAAFLREAGYELLASKAAELPGSDTYCVTPPQYWYDLAMSQRRDDADAIFISCANIHSIDVIEAIERDLKTPVVTSNQAALWHALRTIGIDETVPALGKLLTLKGAARTAAAE
jgi:maleate cis-trans isomerase